jgi:hypothetical protein
VLVPTIPAVWALPGGDTEAEMPPRQKIGIALIWNKGLRLRWEHCDDWQNWQKPGLTLALRWGRFARPVNPMGNPWGHVKGERPWFTLRLSWLVLPWLSLYLNGHVAYFGGKILDRDEDYTWAKLEDFGTDKEGEGCLLTFSVRASDFGWLKR